MREEVISSGGGTVDPTPAARYSSLSLSLSPPCYRRISSQIRVSFCVKSFRIYVTGVSNLLGFAE